MSVSIIRGETDQVLEQIRDALDRYLKDHPDAQIDLYRQSSVSVRIRIIDPGFTRMNRIDRNDSVWEYFVALPDDAQSDISMLVLLAPAEVKRSMANLEFEEPVPADL
jgi:hypothetical protein